MPAGRDLLIPQIADTKPRGNFDAITAAGWKDVDARLKGRA